MHGARPPQDVTSRTGLGDAGVPPSHGSGHADPPGAGSHVADLDVSWLVEADLAVVGALARLQLAARRSGRSLCLHGARPLLVWWLERTGAGEVIRVCSCGPGCQRDRGGAFW